MLAKILFLALIGLSVGDIAYTTVDFSSQLGISFDLPEPGENRLPTVSCELAANTGFNGWSTQTLYISDISLIEQFDFVVKATIDSGGNVNCSLVPADQEETQRRRETVCRDQCANENENLDETTPSTGGEGSSVTTSTGTGSQGSGGTTTASAGGEGSSVTTSAGTGSQGSGGTTTASSSKEESNGSGKGNGKCKTGFTYIKEVDSCYIFSNYTAQWFDAECACASLGSTLAIVNEVAEQFAISGRLSRSSWIGLNDNKVENEFVWRDGSPINFTLWSVNGSENSDIKNCVLMSENHNFSWVAENCEEQRLFVCEEAESIEQIKTPVCSNGWTYNKETKSCYYVTKMAEVWSTSNLRCSDIGGTMATFHSDGILSFLKNLISNTTQNVWIGIKTDSNGKYNCSDGSALNFTYWDKNEPQAVSTSWLSTLQGKQDRCAQISNTSLFWKTDLCSKQQLAVCKRAPELLPRNVCPDGWEFDGDSSCFKVSSSEADFVTSGSLCNLTAFGAKLAFPTTTVQNSFVAGLIKKYSLPKVWAGVTVKQASSSNFGFITGFISSLFGFTSKDCIGIDVAGTWTARSCLDTSRFICSVPKVKSDLMEFARRNSSA